MDTGDQEVNISELDSVRLGAYTPSTGVQFSNDSLEATAIVTSRIGGSKTIDFFPSSDDPALNRRVVAMAIQNLEHAMDNDDDEDDDELGGDDDDDDDGEEVEAAETTFTIKWWVTLIVCVCPDMREGIVKAFAEFGYTLRPIENAKQEVAGSDVVYSFTIVAHYFFEALCMVFKQTNQKNFEGSRRNRAKALGALTASGIVDYEIPKERHAAIHYVLCNSTTAHAILYTELARISKGPGGALRNGSQYMLTIIKEYGLAALLSIYNYLIATNSPVIHDLEMSKEVSSVMPAMKLIASNKSYVGFLGDKSKLELFNKNNYPTLAKVAAEIRAETDSEFGSYNVTARLYKKDKVKQMVEIHHKYVEAVREKIHQASVDREVERLSSIVPIETAASKALNGL